MKTPTRIFIVAVALFSGLLHAEDRANLSRSLKPPVAVIYSGPGTCPECVDAAADIVSRVGLSVRLVQPTDLKETSFTDAVLYVQPGGNAITVARRLTAQQKDLIRTFISQGGGYLGICAGGFFADRWVNNANTIAGLNIIPVSSHDYGQKGPRIMHVTWGNQTRDMYFENGPSFDEPASDMAVVAGRYTDNVPAALVTKYGMGRVAVSGPHPEAPTEWFTAEDLVRGDGRQTDQDLAVALVQSALPTRLIKREPACADRLAR